MFESESFLSRKGALRTVWEAAYFHKKLKKHQVTRTNISSSVDKVLVDEVPVLAYRILGYILLGIVRIYSKKVEYLFGDCHKMLIKIKDFAARKQFNADMEAFTAPGFSITLPKTFELDAFDLEVLEDVSGGNVRPQEEITLQDTLKSEGIGHFFLDQYHFEEVASHPETCSTISPPDEDFLLPQLMESALLVSSLQDQSSMEAGMEKFRDCSFSQAECLDLRLFQVEMETEGSFEEGQHANRGQTDFLETTSSENRKNQITIECHSVTNACDATPQSKLQFTAKALTVTNTLDAKPESNLPDASGPSTPEFIIVHTPTKKEQARIPRKRKCLFDETMVLPNEFLKKSIHSSSDLIRKRRKVPHTAYETWKVYKIANLSRGFLEALIPCISLELRSLFYGEKLMTPELVATNVEAPAGLVVPGSPTVDVLLKETEIAPETPAIHSTSKGISEIHKCTNLDREVPASSIESSQQRSSSSEDQEFDILMNEEINSSEVDNQKIDGWSYRTGMVARYLCRSFLNQKKQVHENVVTLSQFLTGRTKKEGARLFYEILVLKSKGYLDVEQDNAYGDIRVMNTLQMETIFGKLMVGS